jgi:two-component system NtrC family sensor kinase
MGLGLQIVLALAGLMLLAFVPLFFAVASLTRATVLGAREHAALALGHAIAVHVVEAKARGGSREIEHELELSTRSRDIDAACVFAVDGSRIACAGSPVFASAMQAPASALESAGIARGAIGRALEIATHAGDLSVVTRLRIDEAGDHGTPLVRLVALYMATFGLALLVFAYLVLTRLIVRPVGQLVQAADRVASGARTLRVPRSGARELIELGASVQAMTERLIREEAALIIKVEELTQTTTRLTQAQGQLVRSERMASVGRLAAGIAHEIGNPIAALM